MDIQMPEMDGNELILDSYGYKSTNPIIALTAHATLGEEKMFAKWNERHLSKPYDFNVLLEKLYSANVQRNLYTIFCKTIVEVLTGDKLVNFKYLKDFVKEIRVLLKNMVAIF
jgi:CheY-like chemotaxis protein